MKKLLCGIAAIMLAFCIICNNALALDNSQNFSFTLAIDGKTEKRASTGDIVTVTLTLSRIDADSDYTMYAMQDEILFDNDFFELVDGGMMTSSGVETKELQLRNGNHALYMNFVSLSGGVQWKSNVLVGSFQLRVKATSGASVIRSSNISVSIKDGSDSYPCTSNEVTVIVSDDCVVSFDSNGGTDVPSQYVAVGSKAQKPKDPYKEGFELEGWYVDKDLTQRWDFDRDAVYSNITLYAKWVRSAYRPISAATGDGDIPWLAVGLLALIVAAVVLLVLRRSSSKKA